MQKIIIRHLGAIEQLDMDVKKFHLLIGEQGTGKSTIAKGIYYLRNVKNMIANYLCELYETGQYKGRVIGELFYKEISDDLIQTFVSLFGYSRNLDKKLYMRYDFANDIWIEVTLTGIQQYISVRYSPTLTWQIREFQKDVLELYVQKEQVSMPSTLAFASLERTRNYEMITNKVNNIFKDFQETYYIPAGRSMMTLLANSRFTMKSEADDVNLDLVTKRFMMQIDTLAGSFSEGIAGVHKRYPGSEKNIDVKKISEMLIHFLKGDFLFENGREYFVINENNRIPINFASSGQQEILWLLNQLYVLLLKKETTFIIIEEPEAHLYPYLQKDIVEFIAYFMNQTGSTIFLTTHSPYILTSVNTLYCAGKKIQELPQCMKEVNRIVGEGVAIAPDDFSAFKIEAMGAFTDLCDNELDEINTELIDEVSDQINQKYTDLLWVQGREEED